MSAALAVDPVVSHVLAATLALVFALAAWHKLRDLGAFASAVAGYEILPARLVPAAAGVLAIVEATAAALVFAAPARTIALATLVALLVLYAGAMGIALARGRRELDCGCFVPAHRRPVGPELVLRNVVLALLGAFALLPATPRALGALDAATVVAGVATGLLLLAAVDQALANAPGLRALRVPRG